VTSIPRAAALLAITALCAGGSSAAATPPPPLPAPLTPPDRLQPPIEREPDDPLDLLWSHRLNFAAGGAPLVTIRLMEGQDEITFRPHGRARLRARGGPAVEIPAGEVLRVRARGALPAALTYHPLLGEAEHADRRRVASIRRLWEGRGVEVVQRLTGGVYGIAGHVIDNRHVLLVASGDGSERFAREFAEDAYARYGARTGIFTEVVRRPSGWLEVFDAGGRQVARGDALVTLEVSDDAGVTVARVEHDVGYAAHGFDDRDYRGRLHVTLDASGRLAAVLAIPLEELLRGLVPSELPAGSPREALKAQAVTARSNVLAQIGTRHLTDPYVVCSEVHCQAYRGEAAQAPSTDAAVRATAGEALFRGRELVDAVYSAMCGGHGEDNDVVWPNLPDPALRGRPDLPTGGGRWSGGLSEGARLRAFLRDAPGAWCARAAGGPHSRYRWRRRFGPRELEAIGDTLGVGRVRSLEVTQRGVSGRARALEVVGDSGRIVVERELRIRQLLGNLPSAMFVVDRDRDALVLHGGGWGHGVGMCQWGAVGRAQAGQGYRTILRAYYAGADVARIY
jgi:stage II sporulation protein D